jgi:hypothetical protein
VAEQLNGVVEIRQGGRGLGVLVAAWGAGAAEIHPATVLEGGDIRHGRREGILGAAASSAVLPEIGLDFLRGLGAGPGWRFGALYLGPAVGGHGLNEAQAGS